MTGMVKFLFNSSHVPKPLNPRNHVVPHSPEWVMQHRINARRRARGRAANEDSKLKKGFRQMLAEAGAVIDGVSVPRARWTIRT